MLFSERIAKIRRAHFIEGKPIKQICRELRISRHTVLKVIRSGLTEFTSDRTTQPRPRIDPWRSELDEMLAEDRNGVSRCLGELRSKHAEIHRGSRRKGIGPLRNAGYTSAISKL